MTNRPVAENAEFDQKRLVSSAEAMTIEGIQRGLRGMDEGTGQDAEDAFAALEREFGIAERE